MYKRFVIAILMVGFTLSLVTRLSWAEESKRPVYEYPGNYREEINQLKADFKTRFGYELIDLEHEWRPWQIKKLIIAFSELPDTFLKINGVKGFYHLSKFRGGPEGMAVDDIPAATFPSFQTVYRNARMAYQVEVGNQEPRIEFYSSLFYEDQKVLSNIVQHEMAHIYDMFSGYLSFSDEWLLTTKFKLTHLPALDSKPGDDYLFIPLNDSEEIHYAPVSSRQLPTYSRQNPQEDFANSVAAYINYPYFQFSHPKRYQFLKEKVFGGKLYFPEEKLGMMGKVISDFDQAIENKKWDKIIDITKEVARDYRPKIEKELTQQMQSIIANTPDSARDTKFALASCYLVEPNALKIRKYLIRKKRVLLQTLLKNRQCALTARRSFEEQLGLWSMRNIYFYQSKGQPHIQFLDPVSLTSKARGFDTRYTWRIFREGSNVHLAEGSFIRNGVNTGSIKINLGETAVGNLSLPFGKPLTLELGAQRVHPTDFKRLNTKPAKIRFVIPAGFNYDGLRKPGIRTIYPLRSEFQSLN